VKGLGFRVQDSGCRVQGVGFRVQEWSLGVRLRICTWILGCRVSGSGLSYRLGCRV